MLRRQNGYVTEPRLEGRGVPHPHSIETRLEILGLRRVSLGRGAHLRE
jgi:hypothetical protein